MNLKLLYMMLLIVVSLAAQGQEVSEQSQEKTRKTILKVLSRYKNPMSYYPLRRDIFLPSEEETTKDEMQKSYPKGARSIGFAVFIPSNDTTYYREPFVDAKGDILDVTNLRKPYYPSLKSNGNYFRKRQQSYINRSVGYSRFHLFNTTYGRSVEQ